MLLHGFLSWLSVIPFVGLGLHLDPDECWTAVKCWLGIRTPYGSNCALCPDSDFMPMTGIYTTSTFATPASRLFPF